MVPEVRSVISPSELANSRIDLDWNWVGLGCPNVDMDLEYGAV